MVVAAAMVVVAVLLWPPSAGQWLERRIAPGRSRARRSESSVWSERSWWPLPWRSWLPSAGSRPPAGPSCDVVLRVMEDLATQVRAGVDPDRAWVMAWRLASSVATSAAEVWLLPGERPVDAVLRLAHAPGADASMVALAAAWRLSTEIGAPLAEVLGSVAEGVRQDAEIEAEIQAELAAPRATARLLAVLPLAGLGLGQLIGARPFAVLVATAVGRWCAVGGLALALAGRIWTRRLVTRAERLL